MVTLRNPVNKKEASFLSSQLYNAAKSGDVEKVEDLIAHGVDVNQLPYQGTSAFAIACVYKHMDVIDVLLDAGADVDLRSRDGLTPLMEVISQSRNEHIEVVQLLLNEGADMRAGMNDMSPLYYAIQHEKFPIISLLLRYGADVNQATDDFSTPLMIASLYGYTSLVKALLSYGADVRVKDTKGMSALSYALKSMNTKNGKKDKSQIIQMLLDAGAVAQGPKEEAALKPYISLNTMNIASMGSEIPTKCFDPTMYNDDVNIATSPEMAHFYIMDSNGKIVSTACLDPDSLEQYKSRDEYVFYRCKDTVPDYAFNVRKTDVEEDAYRLFNFAFRVYVLEKEAKRVVAGNKYILKPVGPVGRIVSKDAMSTTNLSGSVHCGPAQGDVKYYKIYSIGEEEPKKVKKFTLKGLFKKGGYKTRIGTRKTRIGTRKTRKASGGCGCARK